MTPQEFKAKRKELGLTQRELALALGLSPKNGDVTIRRVEHGAYQPSGLLVRCFELYYNFMMYELRCDSIIDGLRCEKKELEKRLAGALSYMED